MAKKKVIVDGVETEIDEDTVEELQARIDELNAKLEGTQTWTPEEKEAFRQELADLLATIRETSASLTTAQTEMRAQLTQMQQETQLLREQMATISPAPLATPSAELPPPVPEPVQPASENTPAATPSRKVKNQYL